MKTAAPFLPLLVPSPHHFHSSDVTIYLSHYLSQTQEERMEGFERRGAGLKEGMKARIDALAEAIQSRFQEIESRREGYRKGFHELHEKRATLTVQYSSVAHVNPSDWVSR